MPRTPTTKFDSAVLVATPAVLEAFGHHGGATLPPQLLALVVRHTQGDWGDVCAEDAALNDQAVESGDRIVSAYEIPEALAVGEDRVWVITEARGDSGHRAATTILFPSEY